MKKILLSLMLVSAFAIANAQVICGGGAIKRWDGSGTPGDQELARQEHQDLYLLLTVALQTGSNILRVHITMLQLIKVDTNLIHTLPLYLPQTFSLTD